MDSTSRRQYNPNAPAFIPKVKMPKKPVTAVIDIPYETERELFALANIHKVYTLGWMPDLEVGYNRAITKKATDQEGELRRKIERVIANHKTE